MPVSRHQNTSLMTAAAKSAPPAAPATQITSPVAAAHLAAAGLVHGADGLGEAAGVAILRADGLVLAGGRAGGEEQQQGDSQGHGLLLDRDGAVLGQLEEAEGESTCLAGAPASSAASPARSLDMETPDAGHPNPR